MTRLAVVLAAILATGCSAVAVYRHPVTGEVRECEQAPGFFWWSGPLAYGACKSSLEAAGYIRIPR